MLNQGDNEKLKIGVALPDDLCSCFVLKIKTKRFHKCFPRRNQSMTNKTFIGEFLALSVIFAAGYAFMLVA